MGSTVHCDRHLAVSKQWDAAAAMEPENPAARLTDRGESEPTSSLDLTKGIILWEEEIKITQYCLSAAPEFTGFQQGKNHPHSKKKKKEGMKQAVKWHWNYCTVS